MFLKEIPKSIAIVYSIQFEDLAKEISLILSKTNKITLFSQVLGCSNPKFSKDTKAILLISNGKFHAISLAYESKLPVYLFDNGNFSKIKQEEIDKLSKMERTALLKYLSSENIGVIVSTKPGQQRFSQAMKFKNSLKDKNAYLFLSNEVNISEFENFGLESFVNTACPRLDLVSNKIINISKIK
jgi:2-(3-amino-3-carboxypropyl)histidine synthase